MDTYAMREVKDADTDRIVYNHFETNMFNLGKSAIRIDVINDYADNVVLFWQKQGFI